MALFKISKGLSTKLPTAKTVGYCWYTTDDSLFYIDYEDENGVVCRKALNAKDAETLTGASLSTILNSSDLEIPTSKAVLDALKNKADVGHSHDDLYYTEAEIDAAMDNKADKTLVVTATHVEGENVWIADYSSEQVLAHINNGGNTTLSLVDGMKNILLYGVNDDGTVMYGLTLASEDGVANDVFVLSENTLINMKVAYAPSIIPQPNSATAGQLIQIKGFEDGKITETEAVDVYTEDEIDDKLKAVGVTMVDIQSSIETNYNETIIGLSVDGTTVTYIKGDGSTHTFETQDTNTTYSLGTDETTGLTKLYATTGDAIDGTMTQKAIKTELDKKVGVSVDSNQGTLIFTI